MNDSAAGYSPDEAFRVIEHWNKKEIQQVLKAAEVDSSLEEALRGRYQALVDHVDGKGLSVLASLPAKIAAKKLLKKQWRPCDTSKEVMATLPVPVISLFRW